MPTTPKTKQATDAALQENVTPVTLPHQADGAAAAAGADSQAAGATQAARRWRQLGSPATAQVSDFLKNDINGDNLVDTDKFPFWKNEGTLPGSTMAEQFVLKGSKQLMEGLKAHLKEKYLYWYKDAAQALYSEGDFEARWRNILVADRAKRNQIVGDDFRTHISIVVGKMQQDFKMRRLSQQQLEAIAIYSTSQYTQMNALARAGKDQEGVASPLHLWLIAKTSVAINRISAVEDVSKITSELFTAGSVYMTDNLFKDAREGFFARLTGGLLHANTPADEIQKVLGALKFVRRDINTSWDKDDTKFVKPNILNPKKKHEKRGSHITELDIFEDKALASATTNLAGVSPFNDDSSVVFFMMVPLNAPAIYISKLSAYPLESEVLWRPGVTFEIVAKIDNRKGALQSEAKLRKLWVFLRPLVSWDVMYYPDSGAVRNWFEQNIDGKNIVDTDKFKFWNKDGKWTKDEQALIKPHLNEKYYYWFNAQGNRYEVADFRKKFDEIVNGDLSQRNDIVGQDYRHHVNTVAANLTKDRPELTEYALAVAIYSSSQYSSMNAISRGIPGNRQPVNLWFTAKAAVGIQKFGPIPDANGRRWKDLAQPYQDFYTKEGTKVAIQKVVRRDATFDEPTRKKLILDHYKEGDPKNSILKDDALSSSTLKLGGVDPFNEGNVVYFIDVTAAELDWAMYIAPYSAYKEEEEVLWLPRMKFEIVYIRDKIKAGKKSTKDINTKMQVYLRVVGRSDRHDEKKKRAVRPHAASASTPDTGVPGLPLGSAGARADTDSAKRVLNRQMFDHIKRDGVKENQVKEDAEQEIGEAADRGDELLRQLYAAGGLPKEKRYLYRHASDIRAICWALYRRAIAKGHGFVGGMIVVDDGGRLAAYLKRGNRIEGSLKNVDPHSRKVFGPDEAEGLPYYYRASSHFQERRDDRPPGGKETAGVGIDFHGFPRQMTGGQVKIDKSLKLPLQKSTLLFGTLDGGQLSYLKFEYYGFATRDDILLHSKEFVKVDLLGKKEIGHRESPSKEYANDLKKLLARHGVSKALQTKVVKTFGGKEKTLTPEKSGHFFGRQAIAASALDDAAKEVARQALVNLLHKYNTLTDHETIRQFDEVIFSRAAVGAL